MLPKWNTYESYLKIPNTIEWKRANKTTNITRIIYHKGGNKQYQLYNEKQRIEMVWSPLKSGLRENSKKKYKQREERKKEEKGKKRLDRWGGNKQR